MPVRRGPRSGDGMREPSRSDGQWRGKAFLVPFGAVCQKGPAVRAEPVKSRGAPTRYTHRPMGYAPNPPQLKSSKVQKFKRSQPTVTPTPIVESAYAATQTCNTPFATQASPSTSPETPSRHLPNQNAHPAHKPPATQYTTHKKP